VRRRTRADLERRNAEIEALMRFARAVPADFSVPILVVLHIPAAGPERAPSILGRAGAPTGYLVVRKLGRGYDLAVEFDPRKNNGA
jgi:hypothetical protein